MIIYINKYNPDNRHLIQQAEETTFEESKLIDIVDKINGSTAISTTVLGAGRIFRWSLGAGLSLAQNKGIGYNVKAGVPQVSLGLDFLTNPNIQKFFFRTSFSLSLGSYKAPYPTVSAPDNILSIDQFTVSVSPQFIFNIYNKDNFKLFLSTGAAFNLSAHSYTQSDNKDTGLKNNQSEQINFSKLWVNIPLQAGVAINKKWEAAFTYAPYTKLIPGGYSKFSYHSVGIAARFYLDK